MDNIISLFPDSIRAILTKLNFYAVFAKRENDKTKNKVCVHCLVLQYADQRNA